MFAYLSAMTLYPPHGGWDKCLDRTYGIRRAWMVDERKTDILQRLKSVEGHVRGIGRMVEEEAYCIDVVNQILAIQRALKKVSSRMLDQHLHHCVTNAIQGTGNSQKEQILGELIQVFEASSKA